MEKNNTFNCYIIGEGNFPMLCGDILIQKNFIVSGIISADVKVREWAMLNGIQVILPTEDYSALLKREPYDFLFSINNSYVLREEVYTSPARHTINYHYSLLPDYAGSNSPSWAILNQEKIHGISWHCVSNEIIDGGEILKQGIIELEPGETAGSLNLKCFESAVEKFRELVDELAEDRAFPVKQNLELRKYYPLYKRFPAANIIDWKNDAGKIHAFIRALKFDTYTNVMGMAKALIGEELFILHEASVFPASGSFAPGMISHLAEDWLRIQCGHDEIGISKVMTMDGKELTIPELGERHSLRQGTALDQVGKETEDKITSLNDAICKVERYWVQKLASFDPLVHPYANFDLPEDAQSGVGFAKITFDAHLQDFLDVHYDPGHYIFAGIVSYLTQVAGVESCDIGFSEKNIPGQEDQLIRDIFSVCVPFHLAVSPGQNFHDIYGNVCGELQEIRKKKTYAKDIFFRYPELSAKRSKLTDHDLFPVRIQMSENSGQYGPDFTSGITFVISENDNQVTCSYNTSEYSEKSIANICRHIGAFLQESLEHPDVPLDSYSLFSETEADLMLFGFNSTDKPYPKDKTVYELFEQQSAQTPDHIALSCGDREMTYRELNERSNQLARYIRSQFQQRENRPLPVETLIAVCFEKSCEMIVGILAILKAGGAYVPLDPSYPQERIDYILEDTKAAFVLTQEHLVEKGKFPQERTICIDVAHALYEGETASNLEPYSDCRNLAYVIYTSGTTGKPKGVELTFENLNNLVFTQKNRFEINPASRVLQYAALVFDASVWEIFSTLSFGGTLLIAPASIRQDAQLLTDYIETTQVSIATIPPVLLNTMEYERFSALKILILAGESCPADLMVKWSKERKLINAYGPTESTVCATMHEFREGDLNTNIGRPIDNASIFVLDNKLAPVLVGVVGELFIGGAGVARGYLNAPELTAGRFMQNPFAREIDKEQGHDRLFKTGDMARWLPDGNLEFIGRNDDQVKIRGHRIETGEIEHHLNRIAGIRQSVVLAKERKTDTGNTSYLVAYYVPELSAAPDKTKIQNQLMQALPEYMIPAILVSLESFPLTINGKLDKKALPDPHFDSQEAGNTSPVSAVEQELCGIWQEVLGINHVGVNDDFFNMGGDSILAIQVAHRMAKVLGHHVRVADVFEYKTVSKLSEHLGQKTAPILQSESGKLTGELGLLPIQQWFFEKAGSGTLPFPAHWNQSFMIRVPSLDPDQLEGVLAELVNYHDVLRIQYSKTIDFYEGVVEWKQAYLENVEIPPLLRLDVSNGDDAAMREILTDWQSAFELEKGPLFQVGYLYGYEDGSARIYFALHHLIADSVSWRILCDDMQALLAGQTLPGKGSSYRQWVEKVATYPDGAPAESAYWEAQLNDIPDSYREVTALDPTTAYFELEKELTRSLLHKAPEAYHTEINDLLLTALAYSLREINQNDVHGITLEGHGREDLDGSIDLGRTVGWFTTIFPVVLELQDDLGDSIRLIKETLRAIPNKGIGFGAFATSDTTSYGLQDLPPVGFNYFGQFDSKDGFWQVTPEDSGISIHPSNQDPNLVTINGRVIGGQLSFEIVTRLGETITRQLSEGFKAQLSSIIEHCVDKLAKEGSSFTPSDFKTVTISQPLLNKLESSAKADGNEISHIYPANSLQQGFIYHALSQFEDDAYRVQVLYDYFEPLEVENYIRAWEYCIAQYPILRTAFNWEEDVVQVIYQQGRLEYEVQDISHLASQEERDALIREIQLEDRKTGFNLVKPTLLRLRIIKQTPEYFTVLKTEHHSISDGWSVPILLTNLHRYYAMLAEGKKCDIQVDNVYLEAQEYMHRHRNEVQHYWKNVLNAAERGNDINALLSEPIHYANYKKVSTPSVRNLEITGQLYKDVKNLSQQEGVTLNVIVQFIWHKLLQVYSNNAESIVGTTLSGRDLPVAGIEESVGLYINTLPLIIDWDNDDTIAGQMHRIQQKITEMNTHSYAELAKLQKDGERIFHSMLVYENYPVSKEHAGVLNMKVRLAVEKVDYPISIMVYDHEDALTFIFGYDGKHLEDARAGEHLLTLEHILRQAVENSGKRHKEISLLEPQAYKTIVYDWNLTDKDYPAGKTIHTLFAEQVEKNPEAIAVVCNEVKLTYRQLHEKSNALAHHLREQYRLKKHHALEPGAFIVLYFERSVEMLISILAVLKSGGAYVPVDTSYPQERVDYILQDTGAEIILTQRHLTERLVQLPPEKVVCTDLEETFYEECPTADLCLNITEKDLAYVIYTSGSTGKPKGVMVEHQSVVNYINNVGEIMLDSIENVDFSSNLSFDLTVTTTICPLLLGKKIEIYPGDLSNTLQYTRHLIDNQVDFIKSTPLLLANLRLDHFSGYKIKQAFVGGEKLEDFQLAHILQYVDHPVDEYGPTETTVGVTYRDKSEPETSRGVGRPYFNTKVYLLNEEKDPVPVGVAGELHIGGAGLARGYLNFPDLTQKQFVANPFATAADIENGYTRLYKTGDLMRWLPDGSLEFIGRTDDQVKIRGYRIELDEIESALTQLPGIKQSCVIAKERKTESGSSKYLVAYYLVDNATEEPAQSAIQDQLKEVLPEYMVPGAFMKLESFPLTINGKIDKKCLPDPDFVAPSEEYVAPSSETEKGICRIWEEVLELERVGVTDDFFRIGGDSILAIMVSHRMSESLDFNVDVADIFEHPTCARLIAYNNTKNATIYVEGEF